MPWFAIDTDLEGNKKVHAFMRARGWSIERTLVFFYRYLRTVRLHAADGDITMWDDRYLGLMTSVRRPSGLLEDLARNGFIEGRGRSLLAHDWSERNGRWIKDSRWRKNERANTATTYAETSSQSVRSRAHVGFEHEHEHEQKDRRSPPARAGEREPKGFAEFYQSYPRREARRAAAREFGRAMKRHPGITCEDMAWAAAEYAKRLSADPRHEARFTPYPQTWLSQDRFVEFFEEEDAHGEA